MKIKVYDLFVLRDMFLPYGSYEHLKKRQKVLDATRPTKTQLDLWGIGISQEGQVQFNGKESHEAQMKIDDEALAIIKEQLEHLSMKGELRDNQLSLYELFCLEK